MSKEDKHHDADIDIEELDNFSSLSAHGTDEPVNSIPTSIPLSQSIKLFFTRKSPPKEPRPKFFLWFPPGQSKAEKKLVFKVDAFVMTYVCLSYFCRYLDQANLANAYISGMKEDLKITGEEYIWLSQLFSAAYCAAGLFATVLFTKIKFSTLFPFLEITWGIFTLFIFKAKGFKTIAALRFIQGLCEGTAWPAIHFILGSWYTPAELGKRTAIFTASGIAGTLLSGLISSGLVRAMEGKTGLKGWQWLFIVDGIITIPIAILGFFIPPTPDQLQPNFLLNEDEIKLAVDRTKINGKKRVNKLDLSVLKRVATSYNWYLFVASWVFWGWAQGVGNQFGVVLKALKYNTYSANNIPTAQSGVGIAAGLIAGFLVDLWGSRIEVALFLQALYVTGTIIVKVFDVSRHALLYGFIIQGLSYATSPIIVGWCNELTKDDTQLRAITIGSLNFFSGLVGIPYNIKLFNADYAPRYSRGATACLVFAILMFLQFILIWFFDRYQKRKRQYLVELESHNAGHLDHEAKFE
ncbi:hypothetical protein WICMUC_005727 [Wickerhamomyces mucosus]|uniref:Major facilitator superfamily (MFS) profile domain-containing protein n=1 Tax=Wickerhamomyces mucosus TaxID=1378264 RepID=A0A9P8P334_9ASCO|nr:hypothetical protein WICMUC_005727 [Wickerhamomyces mucosus]